MKLSTALLLPTIIRAAVLQPRQESHGAKATSGFQLGPYLLSLVDTLPESVVNKAVDWAVSAVELIVKPAKFVDGTQMAPKTRPDAKRIRARYGPFVLQPQGGKLSAMSDILAHDKDSQTWLVSLNPSQGLCSDCTVIAGQASLTFPNGTKIEPSSGIFTHHVLSRDMSKSPTNFVSTCDTPNVAQKPKNHDFTRKFGVGFIETGTDYQGAEIQWASDDKRIPSGYYVGKNDKIYFNMDVISYVTEKQEFYLTTELEYLPGKVGTDVQTQLVDISSCQTQEPRLLNTSPDGPRNTTSGKYQVYKDGYIIKAHGHMHDGGVRMYLYINDKFICTSEASYSQGVDKDRSSLTGMSRCLVSTIPVKAGDWLSMIAEYDLKKYPQRGSHGGGALFGMQEAMGLWGLFFTPTDPVSKVS